MIIGMKKLHPDAIIPQYAHVNEDLAADLHAVEDTIIYPGQRKMIHTGLAADIPDGFGMIVSGRSGMFIKQGLHVHVGLVDQGYRGELGVLAVNLGDSSLLIHKGDRIAQMRITPVLQVKFEEVDELSASFRGAGGYGSTGA